MYKKFKIGGSIRTHNNDSILNILDDLTIEDINRKDSDGNTLLCSACYQRNFELIKLLIIKGADVNQRGISNRTPLMIICHPEEQINNLDEMIEIINLLLDNEASINSINDFGLTALNYACITKNIVIVELLLQRGASIDIINIRNETILYYACTHSNIEVIKLLLKYGADKIINNGISPLFVACNNRNMELLELLLQNGAKTNFNNTDFREIFFPEILYEDGEIEENVEITVFNNIFNLLIKYKNFNNINPVLGRIYNIIIEKYSVTDLE